MATCAEPQPDDRRRVLWLFCRAVEKLLDQVARDRIGELRASGAGLVNAISALLENGRAVPRHESIRKVSKRSKESRSE